ncbi:phosphoglycolate phosphatase [Saccharospirillum sp. MSK14-1]|uniref:phosphoglycolate phosphatase n=1 Tax=Saccharospirillum sp. MSK14-1 TaxID=1897632 RepID=UPI000D427189|nr:phosphoglycolate phosphatase [Saccharospirillum sp. MSK14-1]PTY37871.1 phosphoglycolate phosphatase [Saccharospirillum sp. MSK14-1]
MTLKAVLFDLDGTLVDSVPGLTEAVNGVLAELGGEVCNDDQVRVWVGNGPQKLIERALAFRAMDLPSEQALERFRHYYEQTLGNAVCYPGVRTGLAALRKAGLKLACVTNKSSHYTEPFLRQLELADAFDEVLCGDEVDRPKPDPQSLQILCDRFGISTREAMMVGDSVNDLIPAETIGMPRIAVSYGYHQNKPLDVHQPLLLTDHFNEVVACCLAH